MKMNEKMTTFLYLALVSIAGSYAQENALRNVPSSLLECYNTTYLMERDNRLPNSMTTLIAILRKIENTQGLNMDLRALSVALLHRFRQDGIVRNPSVQAQDGVTPYAPNGPQFSRSAAMLRLVPGSAILFPNSSLTDVERCTLHFMVSSSIEILERGDEASICSKVASPYRIPRSIDEEVVTDSDNINDDVETLSPEQLEIMRKNKGEFLPKDSTMDPNSMYPPLPPNHPDVARVSATYKESACPIENGVIKTRWGPVGAGAILAGIAAALQPQSVSLADILRDDLEEKGYATGVALDNKWIATFAGDLAEAALVQGPSRGESINIGVTGGWNSTVLPRWYFLNSNDDLEYTTAEIRGDLDGLILANYVASWYSSVSSLRLSQILDMYYNSRGVFNSTVRACNRRELLTTVAPNITMSAQAFSAALVLYEDLARVTIDAATIEKFAIYATNQLYAYIPTSMNNDLTCTVTDQLAELNRASVELTIILDTTWPFASIQPILAILLESVELGRFNSNFTLLSGYDGSIMINDTNSILDFYSFNATQYSNFTSGFDLPKAFQSLQILQTERLNQEQSAKLGGGRSDVVLVVPYMSTISDSDKELSLQYLRTMREDVPDASFLYLTYGSKDRWSSLVFNSTNDIFSINSVGDNIDALAATDVVASRIKQNPKRLINSACGASFVTSGSSSSFIDYVEPSGVNYYRLHPNYFFTSDTTNVPTVKIQGSGWGTLTVCSSRNSLHPNSTNSDSTDTNCVTVTSNTQSITLSCEGASVIHQCSPLYVSVTANSTTSTSYQCTDASVCRFPDMVKYTFSYENLVCTSGSSAIVLTRIIIILASIYTFLH